jgi:hypothetical protein
VLFKKKDLAMPKIKLPEADLIRLRHFLGGLKDENDKKITQDDMAKALHYGDKKTIYRHVFDRNSQEVNSDTVELICKCFNVDLAKGVDLDLWNQLKSNVNTPNLAVKISYPPEFKPLIESRTKRFVGREYVTQAFHEFRKNNDRGYFTVLGEPGTGKSAIAANYVVNNQTICYFHIASQGNNTPEKFLNSIREQLIQRYKLSNVNSANLATLVNLATEKLSSSESLVIVVDALDEVIQEVGAENILFLPRNLPQNVYFFLTRRHYRTDGEKRLFTEVDSPQHELDLRQMKDISQDDIKKCIRLFLNEDEQFSPKLQVWLNRNSYSQDDFIKKVSERVDDNFMYLVCLMDALTREQYADFNLVDLPTTLKDYYHLHWERMGMNNPENIDKKKILYLLKEVRQNKGNIYDEFIAEILNIDINILDQVITEWYQYLREEENEDSIYYDFYHQSFFEYLTQRKESNTEQKIFREVNEALNRHWKQHDPDEYQFN